MFDIGFLRIIVSQFLIHIGKSKFWTVTLVVEINSDTASKSLHENYYFKTTSKSQGCGKNGTSVWKL